MRKKYILLSFWACTNAGITATGVKVNIPIWIISALWASLLVAMIYEHLGPIGNASNKVLRKIKPTKPLEPWKEFDLLPLKYAACLWHGCPPSDDHLNRPEIMQEIARLSLAVKQKKLKHRNGDAYHMFVVMYELSVENDQFSKSALRQYAESSGREIPAFLKE